MTAYLDRNRRAERARLHRILQWCRALLAVAVLAVVLVQPQPVQAGKWHNCRPTFGGQRCEDHTGHVWVVCDPGLKKLQPQSLTCGVK